MKYTVYVSEEFARAGKGPCGSFDLLEEALGVCERIVDDFLLRNYKEGMTMLDLWGLYTFHGDSPFVAHVNDHESIFNGRDYARRRCAQLCDRERLGDGEAQSSGWNFDLPHAKSLQKLRSREIRARASKELCVPICEDYGWRSLVWFPGRSASATAHWWVTNGGPPMIGDLYLVAGLPAYRLHSKMCDDDQEGLFVHADMVSNTYLMLPYAFRTSLVPAFSGEEAEPSDCGSWRYKYSDEQQQLLWDLSRWAANRSGPEDFLSQLLLATLAEAAVAVD
jgi:hypothetical protein